MQQLVEQAVVGTARLASRPATDHPAITLAERCAAASPERRLLLAAGAASIYQSAGTQPIAAPELPEPAPPQSQPCCSAAAATMIDDLLNRAIVDQPLLVEACGLLRQTNQFLPPALLPKALDLPNRKELRAALRGVLGERGRWLAQFNEVWHWARHGEVDAAIDPLSVEAETLWQEGDLEARIELLATVRRQNAELARQWLTDIWETEKAEARQKLLAVFTAEPAAEEVALLERALKDRSAAVRSQAVAALASLPGSALGERMIARARQLLTFKPAAAGGVGAKLKKLVGGAKATATCEVTLPAELPDDWRQDGIEVKPPQGRGERAHWLGQVIALVPPDHWTQTSGLAPAEIIAALAQTDHQQVLIEALTQAAVQNRAADWLVALGDHALALVAQEGKAEAIYTSGVPLHVFEAMPAAVAEQWCIPHLQRGATDTRILSTLVRTIPPPWSEPFGHAYLRWFWGLSSKRGGELSDLSKAWNTLTHAALALPAGCFSAALKDPSRGMKEHLDNYWTNDLTNFQETLRLRMQLREVMGAS